MSTSTEKTKQTQCIKCMHFLRKSIKYKKIINTEEEARTSTHQLGKIINIGDIICDKCRRLVVFGMKRRRINKNTQVETDFLQTLSQGSSTSTSTSETPKQDPLFAPFVNAQIDVEVEYVSLPLQRTVASEKFCMICRSVKGRIAVPLQARLQCFIEKKIFIPEMNRCCHDHLINKRFYIEELDKIKIYSNSSSLRADEVKKFMEAMSIQSGSTILDKIGTFEITEDRLRTFTGLSWENIGYLVNMMVSMRQSECRNIIQALTIFLFKLRSGASNKIIASIFGLNRNQQVSDFCDSVLRCFEKDVLPNYFGIRSLTRDDLIRNHTSETAKKLCNIKDQLALIFDGTYLRHQKSSNNEYQRKSYSGQKKTHLCKPFTICTTDGFVLDILGPFHGTENDASIMKKVISDPLGVSNLMQPGDICIVDRGFRDVVCFLQERGYKVMMPALKGKRTQLTTEEANASRLVTKLRWVVEATHGHISQKYKLLHHQFNNKLLPKAALYCQIACFLSNTFGKRLNSDEKICDSIVERMLYPKLTRNTLAEEVESSRWHRRSTPFFQITSNDIQDFPELTENDLKILFSGSYQFGQAISYLAEMLNEAGNLNLEYAKMIPGIIKVAVRSRHINQKTYKCFINYKPDTIGSDGILRYTCDCANGLRTIGCCSHVAAVIYYLSNARYQARILNPAAKLSELFKYEECNLIINDDSDSD